MCLYQIIVQKLVAPIKNKQQQQQQQYVTSTNYNFFTKSVLFIATQTSVMTDLDYKFCQATIVVKQENIIY